MDHTRFIASLSPTRKATLHQRTNRAAVLHLAGHVGLLGLLAALIAARVPLWPLLLLPYGIAMVFLFTLSHECTHATPFRTKWLNDLVGHAISLPLLLPFVWFRYFHLAHHKHTNDPAQDPELAGGGKPETWSAYLIYLSGWGYWSNGVRVIWAHARGRVDAPYLPPRKRPAMIREARILLGLYALIALSLFFGNWALWLWLVPALIGQPFLRAYLLAEHGACPPVANMLENTRTTLTNQVVRFLAWNMPYHAEHHAMPMVPFHALPALHSDIAAHLKSVSDGYVAFTADYARDLRMTGAADEKRA